MQDDESRRAQRKHWPVVATTLANETNNIADTSTLTERIAAMWPLALEGFALAGIPIPDYARRDAPTRLFQPGEDRPQ
jgi:hypothetical protein